MKRLVLVFCLTAIAISASAQYQFTEVLKNPVTSVKDQNHSGTCWCFATCSFMESELLRMGKGEYDLSEMFVVRNNYVERIQDDFLRRGNGNIGPGSICHMAFKVYAKYGMMPESAYNGINYDAKGHDHKELSGYLTTLVKEGIKLGKRSPEYFELQKYVLDTYLGEIPDTFEYNGKEYTAKSFANMLGLNPDDYVEICSVTHHPFYQKVPVEIYDNWDHEKQYNLPLDEFMEVIDNALKTGYTVDWDGDVMEAGYQFKEHFSIIPADTKLTKSDLKDLKEPIEEMIVTQNLRQEWIETFKTEDQHLEHIVGISKDQNGNKYYITKNSWNTDINGDGYHNMSVSYVRGKTMGIMVHKNAIPKKLRKKLDIK
ncbi:MAG: C1 family peptidase [Bacteroidales bacterium]